MNTLKVVSNFFTWVPMDKRVGMFNLPLPPRPLEKRTPLLWFARNGGELYLVNHSNEVLDVVRASSGGFQSVDDDVMCRSDGEVHEYTQVGMGDAVLLEEYDGFYDLDFILQINVQLKSEKLGSIEFTSGANKGGVTESVLLWNTGEWSVATRKVDLD